MITRCKYITAIDLRCIRRKVWRASTIRHLINSTNSILQDDLHGKHGQDTAEPLQELLSAAAQVGSPDGGQERFSSRGGGGTEVDVHAEGRIGV
jgi:hypothetical protein